LVAGLIAVQRANGEAKVISSAAGGTKCIGHEMLHFPCCGLDAVHTVFVAMDGDEGIR
jgi:hypothetical protein